MQISRIDVIMVWIYILSVLECAYGARRLVLDGDDDLLAAYHTLAAEVQALKTTVSTMQTTISKMQSSAGSGSGSVYVRWGRNSCPGNGTDLVYAGYTGGSYYSDNGGAANYVCLTPDPQWGYYEDNVDSGSRIFGAEYEQGDHHADGGSHYFGKNVRDEDAPCAVCRSARPSVLMMPGRVDCYSGWTKEYSGYLMSGAYRVGSATEFVCVDNRPEVVIGGHPDQNGKLLYLVDGRCGSLKCPPYVEGRELTCVVCTK